ncbi:hypothetical protein AUJ46_05640 [Candidatus Peregrinibacteria bacterium CG1_02_54_53]|nr:MAG: hypothetical protein AUJ46_05640 [Candidatus Peregrinibacteria bacterium CG1_02_54_53]
MNERPQTYLNPARHNGYEQDLSRAIYAVQTGATKARVQKNIFSGALQSLRDGTLQRMRPQFVESVHNDALPYLTEQARLDARMQESVDALLSAFQDAYAVWQQNRQGAQQ